MNRRFRAPIAAGALVATAVAGIGIGGRAPAVRAATTGAATERVAMVIVAGVRLGPDGKMHDTATPADIAARAGQKVIVTVYNYDTGSHTFTAPALHLNVVVPAAARAGVPAVETFSFTAATAGSYAWHCTMPCDDTARGWAMSHMGYMAGAVTVTGA